MQVWKGQTYHLKIEGYDKACGYFQPVLENTVFYALIRTITFQRALLEPIDA